MSANISGEGFAGMTFAAKASTQEEFDAWIQEVRGAGQPLYQQVYSELMKQSSYNPVAYYVLGDDALFDQVIMKYMTPMDKR